MPDAGSPSVTNATCCLDKVEFIITRGGESIALERPGRASEWGHWVRKYGELVA